MELITREPYTYGHNNPTNYRDPTGLCGILGDGPCTPGGIVDDVQERAGQVKEHAEGVADDLWDDLTDWSPKGVAKKVGGVAGGVVVGMGCQLATGITPLCIGAAYVGKRAGKAFAGALFDRYGPASNEWGPINEFDWPIVISFPTFSAAAAAVPYCGDDEKR